MHQPDLVTFREALGVDSWQSQPLLRPQRTQAYAHTLHHFKEGAWVHQQKNTIFEFEEQRIVSLNSEWLLLHEQGFFLDPKKRLIIDSFSYPEPEEALKQWNTSQAWKSVRFQHLSGKVIPFSGIGHSNYYHVFTELLPRALEMLHHHADARLLIMEDSPHFVWEALHQLGIKPSQVFLQRKEVVYAADSWVVIPWGLNFIDVRFKLLRDKMGWSNQNEGTDWVYLSRKKADKRRLLNEDVLIPYLEQKGVKIIFAEDLRFSEQLSLFSRVKGIIAPHGAGLTNMIWMPKVNIVEIRPAGWDNRCFYHLALSLGARKYTIVDATPINANLDMEMDMQVVKAFLG